MSNWEKAQYIVEQLNLKGAGLGNASWAIVSKALDDLEAAQQSFAPDTATPCPKCGGELVSLIICLASDCDYKA